MTSFGDVIRIAVRDWIGGGGFAEFAGVAVATLVGVIIYFLTFRPYSRVMQDRYGYKVFGVPFALTCIGLFAAIILPMFGIDPFGTRDGDEIMGDPRGMLILLAILAAGLIPMSVILYQKSRKIALVFINIAVMLLFFFFAIQFIVVGIMFIGATIITTVMGLAAGKAMIDNARGSGAPTRCPHCGGAAGPYNGGMCGKCAGY